MTAAQLHLAQFIQAQLQMPLQRAEEIASLFQEKSFSKNDLLLTENEANNTYYFLHRGVVRAYIQDLDNNDVTINFYASGQTVCELTSFFKRIPSKENFQALTDCETLCLSFTDLQQVFHRMPEFREFGRMTLVNSYAQVKTRMLALVQETADQRYEKFMLQFPEVVQHAPLKYIASYLGITDSSLSRIRKELVRGK